MTYPLTSIEGLLPADAAKLKAAGIRTAAKLLDAAASARGRKKVAAATGLPEDKILDWVNFADWLRVRGMGRTKGEILRAAGVSTLRELTHRNPEKLAESMDRINQQRKLMRGRITGKAVGQLIERARQLPFKITY